MLLLFLKTVERVHVKDKNILTSGSGNKENRMDSRHVEGGKRKISEYVKVQFDRIKIV